MGMLKDALRKVIKEDAEKRGIHVEFIDSPVQVIETAAQAKYNDIRRVERNYTHGVHKARKEAGNGTN